MLEWIPVGLTSPFVQAARWLLSGRPSIGITTSGDNLVLMLRNGSNDDMLARISITPKCLFIADNNSVRELLEDQMEPTPETTLAANHERGLALSAMPEWDKLADDTLVTITVSCDNGKWSLMGKCPVKIKRNVAFLKAIMVRGPK